MKINKAVLGFFILSICQVFGTEDEQHADAWLEDKQRKIIERGILNDQQLQELEARNLKIQQDYVTAHNNNNINTEEQAKLDFDNLIEQWVTLCQLAQVDVPERK